MTEKPMTVAEVANFLRRSIKSVKRLPIPFSRVGKGRLYCCVLLAMPVGNRLLGSKLLVLSRRRWPIQDRRTSHTRRALHQARNCNP